MTTTGTSSPDTTATGAARPGGPGQLAGRTVSRVGFGAMQLERLREDRRGALALLRRAVELGVDHVDTAHFYGNGFVNGLLREALRPEDGVLVVSKVGADPDPGGRIPRARAAARGTSRERRGQPQIPGCRPGPCREPAAARLRARAAGRG